MELIKYCGALLIQSTIFPSQEDDFGAASQNKSVYNTA